jgi:hypothetical protein
MPYSPSSLFDPDDGPPLICGKYSPPSLLPLQLPDDCFQFDKEVSPKIISNKLNDGPKSRITHPSDRGRFLPYYGWCDDENSSNNVSTDNRLCNAANQKYKTSSQHSSSLFRRVSSSSLNGPDSAGENTTYPVTANVLQSHEEKIELRLI